MLAAQNASHEPHPANAPTCMDDSDKLTIAQEKSNAMGI